MRNQAPVASVYGIDLGKTYFHVVGTDQAGKPIRRAKLTRSNIFEFFANTPAATIGMEACPGSQWLARKLTALGHTVKIIPAQFVKPYVKSNKNDTVDAAAIAEAVTRPTMRFVQLKHTEQVDLQALHRARDLIVSSRTRLVSQMRAYCLEYGLPMRNSVAAFKQHIPEIIADEANDLTPAMRRLLSALWHDFRVLDERVASVTNEIAAIASQSDLARRLESVPGIGQLTATALVAAVGRGQQFRSARDLAAWVGLTPAQYSTGGKTTLLGISKRGNEYVRRLLIHGARSCMIHLDRTRDRLGAWLDGLATRMHPNKVVVALANKLARIAWVILTKPGAIYERRDPRFA